MNNKKPWLTDFCESKHLFVSIIMIQIVVIIYALSFLSFNLAFLDKLSSITLMAQFIGITLLLTLCKMRRFFNYFDVFFGVIVLIAFVIGLTSLLAQIIGYLNLQLTFNLLEKQTSINYVNFKLSISAVIICLALVRYFYIQDQWNEQIRKLSDARLLALQARIKPHFLFNTLNSIASLIHIDADKAELAIADFSNLMRRAFTHKDKSISIKEELNWVKQYLNIEKLRLDERLEYSIHCEDELLHIPIPVLCLQPLVENAILHGIQPLENGGKIDINIFSKNKRVIIQVKNPYIDSQNSQSNGMAIANIRERLRLQYGNKANISINDSDGFFQVSLEVPK
jgi:two-component system sensor histidine kinase AlgZ